MDKKQQAVKEKFQYKLEVAKRKNDFLKSIKELQDAQKDIFNKKQEIKELSKQEKLSYKNDIKNAIVDYKNEIKKQKIKIKKHKDLIRKEQIKIKEISKLELKRLDKEVLSKKYNLQKSLLDIKKQTKKAILDNKKLMHKIRQENKAELVKQRRKYNEKKIELAKANIVHLENLANQKRELENIKKQQAYDRSDLYRKFKKIKNERILARKRQKYELKMMLEKEKQQFESDISKIKREQISYDNLVKLRKQEHKIKNEKLKFETEKLKQDQKLKEAIQNQALLNQKSLSKINQIQKNTFFDVDNVSKTSSIVDKRSLPLKIDLENETIKGYVVSEIGKRAIRVFNKLNVVDISNKIEKAKISAEEKALIKKVRNLKTKNALTPINQYVQLAAFITGEEISRERVHALIVSIIYNIFNGKTFSFLGGYFSLVKVKGYRRIIYSKSKNQLSRFSVINLPDSDTTKMLEEILAKKLKYKPFIKITENVILTNINNQVKVITDLGFMR